MRRVVGPGIVRRASPDRGDVEDPLIDERSCGAIHRFDERVELLGRRRELVEAGQGKAAEKAAVLLNDDAGSLAAHLVGPRQEIGERGAAASPGHPRLRDRARRGLGDGEATSLAGS